MMNDERRQYFRIDDTVGVVYRPVGREEARILARDVKEQRGSVDYAANFDNRIHTLLDACRLQSPIAAEILGLLNKKLNFIVSQIDVDSELIKSVAYNMRAVNISACGMAFPSSDRFSKGQYLQLDLILYPSELTMVTVAEVVACESLEEEQRSDDASYFLRLNFPEISHTDQELLIQHIVKKQSAQLNLKKREVE